MTPYQHTDHAISKMLMNLSKPHCHESASVFSSSTARNAKPCSKFTLKESPKLRRSKPPLWVLHWTSVVAFGLNFGETQNSQNSQNGSKRWAKIYHSTFPTFPWAAFLTFTFQRGRRTDDGLASHLEFRCWRETHQRCISCRPNKSEFKLKSHPKVPKDLCLPTSFIIFQGSTSFHTKLRYPHLCSLVWESLVQATYTVEDSLKIPLFNMGLHRSSHFTNTF